MSRFVDRVTRVDEAVDEWFDRVRGPRLDPLFYGLTSAADHSLLWMTIGTVRAAATGDVGDVVRLVAVLGAESGFTNGPLKWCFGRVRPERETVVGPLPYGVHLPITSSFPSGHAVTAFTAATMLAGGPLTPVWYALAAAVAASRVYVRLHHASDVVVGAAVGVALGVLGRRLLPFSPGRRAASRD